MNLESLLRQLAQDTGLLGSLRERAASRPLRILLPEAADPRVRLAAAALAKTGMARPLLLGRTTHARDEPEMDSVLGPECWLDPTDEARRREAAEHLLRRRRPRGLTPGQSQVLAAEPLHQATALLALGEADALVAGATCTTAAVVRAALWSLGPAPEMGTVSGTFLMVPPSGQGRCLMMADCAVVPDPQPDQLEQIAQATAQTYHRLLARWPAVAFLSFSTKGSADHPATRKMADAARRLATAHPAWNVVGEVQADAALVPGVARAKDIDWGAAGQAEVLIFPDLGSGNIGYKLVERLGGWRAIGPLLQGLRRPVCDLSRGCTARDIVDAAVLVCLAAE